MDQLTERVQLFKDTILHKPTERVPLMSNFWSVKIFDAGYKLSEGLFNYDILEDSQYKFHEKYNFDSYYETNWRNPLMIAQAMGRVNYNINDEANALSYVDECLMSEDDYPALIASPEKFFFTTYIPRKYKGADLDSLKAGLQQFGGFLAFRGKVTATMQEKYGVPALSTDDIFSTVENLGCGLRGLTNLSIDFRRRPKEVQAAIEALDAYFTPVKGLYVTTQPGTCPVTAMDVHTPLIVSTLMGAKVFEKFYMPYLRELYEYLEKYDKYVSLFCEGENSRLYDYFNDLPKNRTLIYLEMDDIKKAKKCIGGTMAIAGGFPSDVLANGTPEECVETARRVLDEYASDGGYVFSINKMISYSRDYSAENLIAINDFVRNYKVN